MPKIFSSKIIASALLSLLFLASPSMAANSGDILINEFSPKSDPEWVELYNPKDDQISVVGWKLRDAASHVEDLPSVCIPSQGFYTYERAKGWLNDTGGDTITLLDNTDAVIDSISYGTSSDPVATPNSDQSASRVPDGATSWQIGVSTRQDTSIPCPADPTPSPSPTPTPTPSPTPTSSSTTKSPSPTPKSTSTSKSPTPTPKSSPQVLGEVSATSSPQTFFGQFVPSPQASPQGFQSPPTKTAALVTGSGLALIALSFGFYLWYKRNPQEGGIKKEQDRFESSNLE